MRACTVLLVILRAAMGNAQSWLPDEAVWHYDYVSGFGAQGFVRVEIVGDTVVDGLTCKRLNPTQHGFNFISGTSFSNQLTSILLQESDGLVRAHVPMLGFDTLYHMHAVPGDVWRLARLPGTRICADDSFVLVTDTGTTIVSGITLRWLAVDVHFMPAGVVESDTVLERWVRCDTTYCHMMHVMDGSMVSKAGVFVVIPTPKSVIALRPVFLVGSSCTLHLWSTGQESAFTPIPDLAESGSVGHPAFYHAPLYCSIRWAESPCEAQFNLMDLWTSRRCLLVPTSWPCTSLTGIP